MLWHQCWVVWLPVPPGFALPPPRGVFLRAVCCSWAKAPSPQPAPNTRSQPTPWSERGRDTAAFVFLFSCFLGRTLIFWKLLPDDGLRVISGSSRPSSWGLGLGTFARQPTPQKHPSAIYFFLLLCCLMDDSTFFCDWIALIYSF